MKQFDNESIFLKIMELKTALYTVLRPLQIGAALAEADKKEIEKLERYGLPAGIAFQLKDDLLDYKEGKKEENLISLKGDEYCQKLSRELVEKAKKGLENVKMRKKEKSLLAGLADFLVERKN